MQNQILFFPGLHMTARQRMLQMSSQLEVRRRDLVVLNQTETTFGGWLTLLGNNTIHSTSPVASPSGDLMRPDWPGRCQPIAALAASLLVSQTPA